MSMCDFIRVHRRALASAVVAAHIACGTDPNPSASNTLGPAGTSATTTGVLTAGTSSSAAAATSGSAGQRPPSAPSAGTSSLGSSGMNAAAAGVPAPTASGATSGGGSAAGTGGTSGSSGVSGAAAPTSGSGAPTAPAAEGGGCAGQSLLDVPDDVGVRGPWDVGVRTVQIGRLTTEVLYPAEPGSTAGKSEAKYDLRAWLPVEDRNKVPAANSPLVGPIGGHLYRDVPIDAAHGPYPVVIFIHGTASMRIASGTVNTHWASRGFVVLAADYPFLGLADKLNEACGRPYPTQDIPGDVNAQLDALKAASGDLAFLKGRVDLQRLGVSGHSQGGCVSAELTSIPNVQIAIPLSGSMPNSNASLKSLIYISGLSDQVIGYDAPLIGNTVCSPGASSSKGAYQDSVVMGPKRLVGITGGGHLVPTDLCQDNAQGRNAIEEAKADGVCGIDNAVFIGLPALFDCGTIQLKAGLDAVIYPSTAALEETLHCKDRKKAFDDMKTKVPQIGEFMHTP